MAQTRTPSGQLDVSLSPQWSTQRGTAFRPNFAYTALATTGIVNGRKLYMPFDVGTTLTVDQWAIVLGVIGAGATTQAAQIGIYAADPTTNLPTGTGLFSLDTLAPTINMQAGTVAALNPSTTFATPVVIPPGRYWLAVTFTLTGTPTTATTFYYLSGHDQRVTFTGTFNNVAYSTALVEAGATGPGATVGTLNANSIYGCATWFRVQ